jgi:hypothetical protein
VFLWGSLQGEQLGLDYDPELLTSAPCSTTSGSSRPSLRARRFEIDGANAARDFLERHGLPEEGDDRLESIALHTTPEIPRIQASRGAL